LIEKEPSRQGHPAVFVALLRGINVGGRSVPMAALRDLCESLGWTKVRTYIQSGNIIFEAQGPASVHAAALETALSAHYSFPIPVMVRDADQWRVLAADRPFGGWSDLKQLSLTLLDGPPAADHWQTLSPWREGDEEIELIEDRVWVKTPGGYGVAKFNNTFLEKKLKTRATTRNRATVEALLAML